MALLIRSESGNGLEPVAVYISMMRGQAVKLMRIDGKRPARRIAQTPTDLGHERRDPQSPPGSPSRCVT